MASTNNETANENGQLKPGTFAALLEQAQSIQNMLRDALLRTNQLLGGLKQYRRQAKVDEQHAGFAAAASGSRGVTSHLNPWRCMPGVIFNLKEAFMPMKVQSACARRSACPTTVRWVRHATSKSNSMAHSANRCGQVPVSMFAGPIKPVPRPSTKN